MNVSLGRDFLVAYVDEFARVVGALVETPVRVEPGAPTARPQWVATIGAASAAGVCTIAIDERGANAIVSLMSGGEAAPTAEPVAEAMGEIHRQTVAALSSQAVAGGAQLAVRGIEHLEDPQPDESFEMFAIAGDRFSEPLLVMAWGLIEVVAEPAPPDRPEARSSSAVEPRAPRREPAAARPARAAAVAAAPQGDPPAHDRIEVILDIELPLTVRFGQTELPLKTLTRLSPGSIIDLGRSPDEPVELLVSDHVVARGEVVVVAGNYGIRILDVVSARERARVMEG